MALVRPLVRVNGRMVQMAAGDAVLDRSPVTALGVTGTVNIDCSLGNYFTLDAPTANVTLTVSNVPASPNGYTMMLRFKQHGTTARTLTQFAGVLVAGGGGFAVSTGLNAIDVLAYTTFDNGTTWFLSAQKAFA